MLVLVLLPVVSAGCAPSTTFVPDMAIVNGGMPKLEVPESVRRSRDADRPIKEHAAQLKLAFLPTESVLHWSSREGGAMNRETGARMAVIYYGHKEKPPKVDKAKKPKPKPAREPLLIFGKTIKDGRSESRELFYDEPPPEKLVYRFRVYSFGSADYRGPLRLVDQLPKNVRFLGIKDVRKCHVVDAVFFAYTSRKTVEGWQVKPEKAGEAGARVEWSIDDIEIKRGHWLDIDLEFAPPPFEVQGKGNRQAASG